jgi:deoxyribonuclease-4
MRPSMSPSPKLPPLGTHVSVAGGLPTAMARAAEIGCTAAQIFVKNGNQWQGREVGDEEVAAFRAAHAEGPVGPLLAHASYLINLCAVEPPLLARSRAALGDELARCARLGVAGLVVHPGAHRGAGEEAGIDAVAASLDAALTSLPGCSTRVLLENTAGQGTCLGHRLEHLAAIRDRAAARDRIGICLDTCHAFAAGYPLHEPAGYEEMMAEIAERIGLAALGALHVNDSLRPFGSRRDRHAHIGEGEIGLDAFARLLADPRLRRIPMIVETEPGDDMAGHRKDLETLRSLASLPSLGAAAPPKRRPTRPAADAPGESSSGRTRSPRTSTAGSSRSRPG